MGRADGGVLLAGGGGSGKSTTALACLGSSLQYLGDDYCSLADGPEPRAFSVYGTGKLNRQWISRMSELVPALSFSVSDGDKAICFLRRHVPDKLLAGFPVKAILIVRIHGGSGTFLRPASAVEGLKALAPSTVFQLRRRSQDDTGWMALTRLVRQRPCHILEVGSDLARIPAPIENLLAVS